MRMREGRVGSYPASQRGQNEKNKSTGFRDDFRQLRRAVPVLRQLSPHILLLCLARTAAATFLPYIPIYMSARIVTELTGGRDFRVMVRDALITVSASLVLWFLRELLNRLTMVRQPVLRVNHEMLLNEKAHSMDFLRAEDPDVASLKERVIENTQMFGFGLSRVHWDIANLFGSLLSIATALSLGAEIFRMSKAAQDGLLGLVNRPLGIVLFAAALLLGVGITFVSRRIGQGTFYKRTSKLGEFNSYRAYYQEQYMEDNKAAKDIRIFGQKDFILRELRENAIDPLWELRRKTMNVEVGMQAVVRAWTVVMGGLVYAFVGLKAFSGTLPVGSVVRCYGAVYQLLNAVNGLSGAVLGIRENTAYLKLFFEYMDIPSEMQSGEKSIFSNGDTQIEIEFHEVCFRYPGTEKDAVHKLSLKFRAGEHLAVVGKNGSGKTTMIKLLCRLYEPTSGYITANGTDIREYSYEEYLALFSVVFQDFRLLAFPLGQNVAASMDYDADAVWESLALSGAKERVTEFPQQLENALYKQFDEDGIDISGGEEQKIAIARALYKDAPFVILDEPTAALDPISEYEIYTRFDAIAGGKSAIYISHRLSSCRFCDRIAVFHEGALVQHGKHEKLLEDAQGLYHSLWNAQAQYYNLKETETQE